ncbi:DUF2254 domain-containing protein [Mechercharimyces sp. CAU 1602]|uniref:DUF2254 domain-containing protein n=1 Tax=Mechercharimyces sp. CAU 1602 TaxID=2973933 RepID=UPI00216179CC|nr:DUF2254 domain-containing protein [Mechercharimyces sp. CAU 1602]MCS1351876.1 DUF2254 domain-containing protein [Mechercharimyces sp. CAU 1602]
MNSEKLWVKVRDSFWFLPALYSLISFGAVLATSALDVWVVPKLKDLLPSLLLTEKSVAQDLYSSLITSILTMTTISFSTIMVVLTTYTTQFSPRTLQDFMGSRVTQHVLGVYSFGFVFSLLHLLLLGGDQSGLISPTLTVLVAVVCLAFFILFIHHSARFVQVNNLIGQIRSSASQVIQTTFSDEKYHVEEDWDLHDIKSLQTSVGRTIAAPHSGYIQRIQFQPLLRWAQQNNLLLEAHFRVGDYIQKGLPLFTYWQETDGTNKDLTACTHYILIGNERTDDQDIEFSIQKLVEVAVKAISPSINDPHTAVNCINRIGSLLFELAIVYRPLCYFADSNHQLRLIIKPRQYKDYLYKAFYQIRIYGKHDISVVCGILEALYKIALIQSAPLKKEIWSFARYIMEAVDEGSLSKLDHEYYQGHVRQVAEACGKSVK